MNYQVALDATIPIYTARSGERGIYRLPNSASVGETSFVTAFYETSRNDGDVPFRLVLGILVNKIRDGRLQQTTRYNLIAGNSF